MTPELMLHICRLVLNFLSGLVNQLATNLGHTKAYRVCWVFYNVIDQIVLAVTSPLDMGAF
jgi:hypothetical protein